MCQSANYRITFSHRGMATGWQNALGNTEFTEPNEVSILCWLHRVVQSSLPRPMKSAGIEFENHMPLIGYVIPPGVKQPDGSVVPDENKIPDFAQSSTLARATHIRTGVSGKFYFYRRELEMGGYDEVMALSGEQIYGFLLLQS